VRDVVVRDVDNAERLLDFAEVVSHPSESAGEVLDVRAKEDGKRLAIATRVQDTFIAIGESDFELVDSAIGEVGELESSGASAVSEELLEGEGASGGLDDVADGVVVDTEGIAGSAVRARRSEGLYDLGDALPRRRALGDFELLRRSSHDAGLYHEGNAATATAARDFQQGR
jgi:hypothetical protein